MLYDPPDHADAADAPEDEALVTVSAAHVKPEKVKWLWPGRVPFGKLTVLDGDPGLGKSTITLDLGARVTTASPLPDGHRPAVPMGVLLLSAEDGLADTIVPRLTAAGADLALVRVVDHVTDDQGPRPIELPADLGRIEARCNSLPDAMQGHLPGLIVVDPLMAFLGGEVNANRDQDVRRVLFRLKLMAEKTGCAVVCVRHLNKTPGASALYRGGGSIGIIGAARTGLLVGVDPDDEQRRVLAVAKSNLAAKPESLAYRIVGDELYDTAKVVWDGTSGHSAEQLLGRPLGRAAPKREAAEAYLLDALGDGKPRSTDLLRKYAELRGLTWKTVQRAAEALEVDSERRPESGKRGRGPAWWWLPNTGHGIEDTTNTAPFVPNSSAGNAQVSDHNEHPNRIGDMRPSDPPRAARTWACDRCDRRTTRPNVAAFQDTNCGGRFVLVEVGDVAR